MEESKRTADVEINTDQGYRSLCGNGNRLVEGHLSTQLSRRRIKAYDNRWATLQTSYALYLTMYANSTNEENEIPAAM